MYSLEEALDSFNRKERNLLVRAALGHEGPLHLSEHFRKNVARQLDLPGIPKSATWATDYHISWLAGALALFVKGEERALKPWRNERQLVEGNLEDVDLVIATGRQLILIEAKAYSGWSNKQLTSKLDRLRIPYEFYCEISAIGSSECTVNFHFLLTSPKKPTKKLTKFWPNWACKGPNMPWIQLEIDKPNSVFEVTRCDEDGTSSAQGGSWRIKRVPQASAGEPPKGESGAIRNYVDKFNYNSMIRKCEQDGSKIKVGFQGGIERLRSTALRKLQQRSYKWDMTDTPTGPHNEKNWLSGEAFLSECREIREKESVHAPSAS